jgi:hypothetical protein
MPEGPHALAAAVVCLTLALCPQARAETSTPAERRTLDDALLLAGLTHRLPIMLAPTTPEGSSLGVEAWIIADRDGPRRIVVYTRSETFRCASALPRDHQCLLKLASVLVHEAWHLMHDASEAEAYAAQIAFLTLRGGSAPNIAGVLRAKAHVIASRAQRLVVSRASP